MFTLPAGVEGVPKTTVPGLLVATLVVEVIELVVVVTILVGRLPNNPPPLAKKTKTGKITFRQNRLGKCSEFMNRRRKI